MAITFSSYNNVDINDYLKESKQMNDVKVRDLVRDLGRVNDVRTEGNVIIPRWRYDDLMRIENTFHLLTDMMWENVGLGYTREKLRLENQEAIMNFLCLIQGAKAKEVMQTLKEQTDD